MQSQLGKRRKERRKRRRQRRRQSFLPFHLLTQSTEMQEPTELSKPVLPLSLDNCNIFLHANYSWHNGLLGIHLRIIEGSTQSIKLIPILMSPKEFTENLLCFQLCL